MKILFDFLTLHYKNGASEYTRRIFYALLERIETEILKDVWIYCLYDSKGLPSYEEFSPNKFHHNQVRFVDYQLGSAIINLKSASNLNGNLNCSKELEHYAS